MEFTKDIEFNNMPSSNQNVTVTYHGFLSNSSELWMVYGFGESWNHTTEVKMEKQENGFSAEIKILDFDTFNFCFKNANNEWDNNSNCNYISPIIPLKFEELQENSNPKKVQNITFDLNELIEELLEPIVFQKNNEIVDHTPVQIDSKPIDLGAEIANVLSEIKYEEPDNLIAFSSLDEILSGTVINEKTIDLFEDETTQEEQSFLQLISEKFKNASTQTTHETIQDVKSQIKETNPQTALVAIDDPFIVSSRKLSKFYLLKKQIKLAFYKALIKIPNLIFGSQEDQ